MSNLIELTVDVLGMLEEYGYHSVMHVDERNFIKEVAPDTRHYYILRPSMEIVAEEYTEINGQFYAPLLSADVRDMAKNDVPLIAFVIELDDDLYSDFALFVVQKELKILNT